MNNVQGMYGTLDVLPSESSTPPWHTHSLTVTTQHGTPNPGATNALHGSEIHQTIAPAFVDIDTGIRAIAAGAEVSGNDFTQHSPTNVSLTITNNATLTWLWMTNYWLETKVSGNGGVNQTSQWISADSNLVITATADPFHNFTGWSGDTNDCIITGTQITAVMDQPRSIEAAFAPNEYTLTVQSLHGYPIPSVGIHTNIYGAILTNRIETATYPDRRYLPAGWNMTGHDPAFGLTNAFSMTVTNNAVLTWQWSTQYVYTVSAAPGGSVTGTESGWYNPGTVVSNTASPREDGYFWRWTGVSGGMATNNPLVFALTNGHPNVTARFRSNRPEGFVMQFK